MKPTYVCQLLIIILAISFFTQCGEDYPDYNQPSDHTLSFKSRLHKPGLYAPLANCASCHGADLTGGTSTTTGVATASCYTCHFQRW